ncbi:toluene-tolerance protein [Alcanivorax hongdengensis A-11-3]|uniref:Toluene-tolerance protein n=1 Tax=Alcanivorax hongdengensis A-11-3 TaxID=1177179 RepID=L0WBM8_9GAMM|nr:ABC transporter substrate-binding protein [Alcanivorax hongdengensis]EKF74183.1 toluene-tolerance protein [Alcanivorax hongdengensis A-11-3]
MHIQRVGQFILALLLIGAAGLAQATSDPREVVVNAVDRMTQRIDAEREALDKDPEKAKALVREELGDLVDFKRITRMVMGDYFKQATREQKYHFLDVFKNSLINTYASGITLYQGQKIKTLPMQEGDRKGDYARVRMEITTNSGKVVPIFYTLFQRDAQWKVINVYVNGLDLRDTFKAQFAQGMQQYQDIDQVINHWSADAKIDTGIEEKTGDAG